VISFPPVSPPRPYTPHVSSPIRATCPAHLILLDFITRTILGEGYKSFSSSLCNVLHSPVTSSLLGPNILLNTQTHSSNRNIILCIEFRIVFMHTNFFLIWPQRLKVWEGVCCGPEKGRRCPPALFSATLRRNVEKRTWRCRTRWKFNY